jgi:pimeloyl-ACP methyl ester carboxylesterase
MKEARVKTGSIKVNVSATESQPGTAVIFIHGFPFNKDIWNEQMEALPEHIQGIAYDVRGHGKTSSGHGYFSIDQFANDLLNLIKFLKLKKVILCGISMGGYIALRATEISPETISGLILCDTNSSADSTEAKLNRFTQIETIINKDLNAFVNPFLKKLFSANTVQKKPKTVDFIREVIFRNKEKNICATLLALASRTDTTDSLDKINVPVLIIRGEEDQIISNEQINVLHQHIKKSELKIIPLSGHLPNLENPEEFNAAMNRFLIRNFPS